VKLEQSDQGVQYTCADWRKFVSDNNLELSMSRRGNCHDNVMAESFFATFKKRVTQRKIYATSKDAKAEIFNFIEMFYHPVKRHSHTGGISPVQFEEDYFSRLESV
jgi:putative transposase